MGEEKVVEELRDELVAVIRRKIHVLKTLHAVAIREGFARERAIHAKVADMVAAVIRELEAAGFVFDVDMTEAVLQRLGRNWVAHIREYVPV